MQHVLRRYLSSGHITARVLAEQSGIHEGTLSRYLNGQRTPKPDSEQVHSLAAALAVLLREAGDAEAPTEEEIRERLNTAIRQVRQDSDVALHVDNLRKLLSHMKLGNTEYAALVHYTPSGMSRILSKERAARDPEELINMTVALVAKHYAPSERFASLQEFLENETGERPEDLTEACALAEQWLCDRAASEDSFSKLLDTFDEFDYGTYMANVDMSAVEAIPTFKWQIPTTKKYVGQRGLEEGIRDFLKATVTSASTEEVFLFSDHPIEHLSDNYKVVEEWQRLLGAAILQGKKASVLANMDRSDREMVLGLASWMPLYMTGQVKSYYMTRPLDPLFHHVLMVSGGAVLSGYAIGDMVDGSYTLSKVKTKVAAGRRQAESMLADSKELISVFDSDKEYKEYKENPRFNFVAGKQNVYQNLTIEVSENEEVILSRLAGTHLHFLIRHPGMVNGICNLLQDLPQ